MEKTGYYASQGAEARLFPWPTAPLRWLLAVSALLMAVWSFLVPIFEGPDEPQHWQYARYVRDQKKLPFYDSQFVEAVQPPLYYLLLAPFAFPTETPSLIADSEPRRFFNAPYDFNRYWPIRAGRLITAIISLFAIYFAYLSGAEATGSPMTGLLAAGLTGLLPQFTFRGMNISNDALVTTTSAAAVYLVIRIIKRGFTPKLGVLSAVVMGLAILSKVSAMFLPVSFALALLSGKGRWPTRFSRLTVLGLTLAILTPWCLRNQMLYGDPFASRAMVSALPNLLVPKSITSPYFRSDFPIGLAKSFVGVFGWLNVPMSSWTYDLFAALGLLGAVGYIRRLIRVPEERRLGMILLTVPLFALVLTVHLNLTFTQAQGRLLFPALTTVALLIAMGLEALPYWRPHMAIITVMLLVTVNVAVLGRTVIPAYWVFPEDYGFPIDASTPASVMRVPAGPLVPGLKYAQSFVAHHANLAQVEVQVATYLSRISKGVLRLHLRQNLEEADDIASRTIALDTIADNSFVALRFPAIPDSEGRTYYLVFETEGQSEPITAWLTQRDEYPEGRFFIDGNARPQDVFFRARYRSGTVLACPSSSSPCVTVDLPARSATVSGKLRIVGWALDDEKRIAGVEVMLDGTRIGEAHYGLARPDVCALWLGRPGCPDVGFELEVDGTSWTLGPHVLTACATDTASTPRRSCLDRRIEVVRTE